MQGMERTRLLNWEKWPDEWEYVLWASLLERPFTPEEKAVLKVVSERLWPGQNGWNRRHKYDYTKRSKKVYKVTHPDGEVEIFRSQDAAAKGLDISKVHLRNLLQGTYVYKKRYRPNTSELYKDFTGYKVERVKDPNDY